MTFAGNGSLATACAFFPEPPHTIPTSVSICSQMPCQPLPASPTRNSLPTESPNPLGCEIQRSALLPASVLAFSSGPGMRAGVPIPRPLPGQEVCIRQPTT
jgi:hypothetical protein